MSSFKEISLGSPGNDKALAESYIAKTKKKVRSEADFIEILSSLR